jgi:hypothetical protein
MNEAELRGVGTRASKLLSVTAGISRAGFQPERDQPVISRIVQLRWNLEIEDFNPIEVPHGENQRYGASGNPI